MITPKELCDKGICASFAEARRLMAQMNEEQLENFIWRHAKAWGRKPRTKTSSLVWPKESHVTDMTFA